MRTLLVAIILLLTAALLFAECSGHPVICPIDGERMYESDECRSKGNERSCRFTHRVVIGGTFVTHSQWVTCW
jgi:hypothetical protein